MKMKEFGFWRGVNLGGWFSQCDYSRERLDHFITEKDLDVIAGWGLDHVRVPMDYNVLETEDGKFSEEGFERIRRVTEQCGERGLRVVLDLHKTVGFSFDSEEQEEGFFTSPEYQERFWRLWEELSRAFCDPDRIAFEMLNEVTDREWSDAWNRIAAECIVRIRKNAPKSLILLGGYHNNSPEAVKDLDAPADDRVIYNNISSLGIAFEEAWIRILLADALFMNTDRHMRNFGFIRSAETGRVLRMAPNYDNNQAYTANPGRS